MQHLPRKLYTRVTRAIGTNNGYDHIPLSRLERAADRGRRAHKLCELFACGELIADVDEDCKGFFESFKRWFSQNVAVVLDTEKRFYDDAICLTGQVDLIVRLNHSQVRYIIDIKTASRPNKNWALQTAAYHALLRRNEGFELGIDVAKRACLLLDREGGEAQLIKYDNTRYEESVFLEALGVHWFFYPLPEFKYDSDIFDLDLSNLYIHRDGEISKYEGERYAGERADEKYPVLFEARDSTEAQALYECYNDGFIMSEPRDGLKAITRRSAINQLHTIIPLLSDQNDIKQAVSHLNAFYNQTYRTQ
jgi:hypothetical protein